MLEKSGYSEKAIKYYEDKVNVGIIENADMVLDYTGPCGDAIKEYLEVDADSRIEDAKFLYLGCPGLASSVSMLTRLTEGKTIAEAKKISENDIVSELGGLPKSKLDCPKLAVTTLQKAIAKYEGNRSLRKSA